MQTRNKLLDDLSKVMTNAMGVAQGAKTEADNAFKNLLNKWLADKEFITREEFDAVKAMAAKSREENQALWSEIEELRARLKNNKK
jgi:hypothetical protein